MHCIVDCNIPYLYNTSLLLYGAGMFSSYQGDAKLFLEDRKNQELESLLPTSDLPSVNTNKKRITVPFAAWKFAVFIIATASLFFLASFNGNKDIQNM